MFLFLSFQYLVQRIQHILSSRNNHQVMVIYVSLLYDLSYKNSFSVIIFHRFVTLFIRNKLNKLGKFYKFLMPALGELSINTNNLHDHDYPSLTRNKKGTWNSDSHYECGLKPLKSPRSF